MGAFNGVELDGLRLLGPRLLLRPWDRADAPRVRAVMRDARMREFLAVPRPYTDEAALRFVTEIGDEGRREGTGLGCALVERATGRVVGSAALRLGRQPDVGYWVAPEAWGQGYAAEAVRVLCDWGFGQGLPRIQVSCDVRNVASARTALTAGFRYEGTLRDYPARPLDDAAGPRISDLAWFGRLAREPGEPGRPSFGPIPADGVCDGVVTLRVLLPGDADALAAMEDEVALGWSFTGRAPTRDDLRRRADRAGLEWLVGRAGELAIVESATGAVAGTVTLRLPGPPGVGGIGYTMGPAHRGLGYTTRSLRLLVSWAFAAGFTRLELGAKAGNIASQRVALAAGFAPDGVRAARLRNPDGSYSDEARFALLNPRVRLTR